MLRKWVLSAVVVAAGLFAVGCGQVSEATKKGTEASKAAGEKAKDEVGRMADAAGGKVKEVVDELNKELPPIQKKLDDIEKSMNAEKDAGKKGDLAKLLNNGNTKLKEITDAIKSSFAPEKLKELASDEARAKAKEAIMAKIAELKKTLGL